jgi:hypothetical protein
VNQLSYEQIWQKSKRKTWQKKKKQAKNYEKSTGFLTRGPHRVFKNIIADVF